MVIILLLVHLLDFNPLPQKEQQELGEISARLHFIYKDGRPVNGRNENAKRLPCYKTVGYICRLRSRLRIVLLSFFFAIVPWKGSLVPCFALALYLYFIKAPFLTEIAFYKNFL